MAGMGAAQKIAAVALTLLFLIAAMAFLSRGSNGSATSTPDRSTTGFSPETYASDGSASPGGGGAQDDGLPVVAPSQLPDEARRTIDLIDEDGPYPYARDGVVFRNSEGRLPTHPRGWYHEYTVRTPGESDRGARRIIKGKDGTMYYTPDHYRSFSRVQR